MLPKELGIYSKTNLYLQNQKDGGGLKNIVGGQNTIATNVR
jgi:hypothetical protein